MSPFEPLHRAAASIPAQLRRLAPDPSIIDADVERWSQRNHFDPSDVDRALRVLIAGFPEYRNLLYHRLRRGGTKARAGAWLAARLWREMPTLDLACEDIGPGLTIAHGYGTILTAERIGRDCWVHQQVTLGWDYKTGGAPVLGDGVFIGAGAKVLGKVHIGDGARIGANAVVLSDVPAGATAVGVPARILGSRP